MRSPLPQYPRRDQGVRNQVNVQDQFLNQIRREHVKVKITLLSGETLEGTIDSFDNFSILIQNGGQHLIYKHGIAKVSPAKEIRRQTQTSPMSQTAY